MFSRLTKKVDKPLYRYLFVGGTAYVIEIGSIVIMQRLGTTNVLAVALSFWIGLLYSFIMQKFFSFGDRRTHHKILTSQIAMMSALVLFNFGFTVAVTALLQHLLPTLIIRTVAIGMTALWNFYLYKNHIFKMPVVD